MSLEALGTAGALSRALSVVLASLGVQTRPVVWGGALCPWVLLAPGLFERLRSGDGEYRPGPMCGFQCAVSSLCLGVGMEETRLEGSTDPARCVGPERCVFSRVASRLAFFLLWMM